MPDETPTITPIAEVLESLTKLISPRDITNAIIELGTATRGFVLIELTPHKTYAGARDMDPILFNPYRLVTERTPENNTEVKLLAEIENRRFTITNLWLVQPAGDEGETPFKCAKAKAEELGYVSSAYAPAYYSGRFHRA